MTSALAKVREMDAECVSADEILYMATTGGAHAMQLFDCDSLAVGKKADLVMIDLNQPNMQPENNIGYPFNKDIIQTQINADFTICVNLRSYLKQTD